METVKIEITEAAASRLIVILNMELREMDLTPTYARELNESFKALVGHDHESMSKRKSE